MYINNLNIFLFNIFYLINIELYSYNLLSLYYNKKNGR